LSRMDIRKSGRLVPILVGLIGVGVLLPPHAEGGGPSRGNSGVQPGVSRGGTGLAAPKMPSGSGLARGSGQQSGPMTFGYWDGYRFVRDRGSWGAPDTGSRPARQPRSR
jgi:hypothetical protein